MSWLSEIRIEKGFRAVDVAKSVGISRQRYYHIESQRSRPTIIQAKKIGKLLDFNWTRFYDDIQ